MTQQQKDIQYRLTFNTALGNEPLLKKQRFKKLLCIDFTRYTSLVTCFKYINP